MKYKIAGILNLVFGVPQLLISLILPGIILPKLVTEFNNLNIAYQLNSIISYFIAAIIFIEAATNIYLGMKNLNQAVGKPNKEKDKYFRYSVMSAIVTVLTSGLLIGILVINIILPIYDAVGR